MTKDALRQQLRQQRLAFVRSRSATARDALHMSLAGHVCAHLPPRSIVGSYRAVGSEVDPQPTEDGAKEIGCTIAYPWFADRNAEMLFRRCDTLVPGPFGFPQPTPAALVMRPDVLLVPLVGIDRNGNRIGQGAGHYDRYIANKPVNKSILLIGLSYEIQIVDEIPTDGWDIPLHAIATPERWINIAG